MAGFTLTRKQRINNISSSIVAGLKQDATQYRKMLTEGADVPEAEGLPAMKYTGEELRDALGENLKPVEQVLAFILDGKSNKMPRPRKSPTR